MEKKKKDGEEGISLSQRNRRRCDIRCNNDRALPIDFFISYAL